jgi:hypothetical protein
MALYPRGSKALETCLDVIMVGVLCKADSNCSDRPRVVAWWPWSSDRIPSLWSRDAQMSWDRGGVPAVLPEVGDSNAQHGLWNGFV